LSSYISHYMATIIAKGLDREGGLKCWKRTKASEVVRTKYRIIVNVVIVDVIIMEGRMAEAMIVEVIVLSVNIAEVSIVEVIIAKVSITEAIIAEARVGDQEGVAGVRRNLT